MDEVRGRTTKRSVPRRPPQGGTINAKSNKRAGQSRGLSRVDAPHATTHRGRDAILVRLTVGFAQARNVITAVGSARGLGTIRLKPVEFRILTLLASQPYRAFSRRRIAVAVSTSDQPVTEATLGRYIRSLRDQLGYYADYVQKVPYIGYRFKA